MEYHLITETHQRPDSPPRGAVELILTKTPTPSFP